MNIIDFLPHGMTGENIIVFAAGAVAFATVYAVWSGMVARDPLGSRAKTLRQHRQTLKDDMMSVRRTQRRTKAAMGVMRKIINRFDLMRSHHAAKTVDFLAQAGWRAKDSVIIFLFAKICLPFVCGGAALIAFYVFSLFQLPDVIRLLVAMVCVVVGAYLPEIFVKNVIQKRRALILKGLPDALDLLVICAEAGLALDAALTRVAREMVLSSPQAADELMLTSVELGFLPDRKMALQNLVRRTDMPSIRGVVNTLLQTEKYGDRKSVV